MRRRSGADLRDAVRVLSASWRALQRPTARLDLPRPGQLCPDLVQLVASSCVAASGGVHRTPPRGATDHAATHGGHDARVPSPATLHRVAPAAGDGSSKGQQARDLRPLRPCERSACALPRHGTALLPGSRAGGCPNVGLVGVLRVGKRGRERGRSSTRSRVHPFPIRVWESVHAFTNADTRSGRGNRAERVEVGGNVGGLATRSRRVHGGVPAWLTRSGPVHASGGICLWISPRNGPRDIACFAIDTQACFAILRAWRD